MSSFTARPCNFSSVTVAAFADRANTIKTAVLDIPIWINIGRARTLWVAQPINGADGSANDGGMRRELIEKPIAVQNIRAKTAQIKAC